MLQARVREIIKNTTPEIIRLKQQDPKCVKLYTSIHEIQFQPLNVYNTQRQSSSNLSIAISYGKKI